MTRSRYLDWLAADLEAPASPALRADGVGPDLVIGFGTNYGPFELAPFVRSLRHHSTARLALVADDAPDVNALLRENKADRFDMPRSGGWAPHLLIGRFKHYLAILDAYPDARRVLISDVRDVAFQGDPFAHGYADDDAPLVFYAETNDGGLRVHGANPRWLDTLVGPLAPRLFNGAVVCGGSIMGTPPALKRAIRILLTLCAVQRSEALNGIGADQAALNVIAHWDLADAMVSPNYQRIATIGYATPPTLSANGTLHNANGSVSPIVHQYDRHDFARAAIETRWSEGLTPRPSRKLKGWAKFQDRWRKSWGKRVPELR